MIRLDFSTEASRRKAAAPYLNYVADRACEVVPAIVSWRESEKAEYRLYLASRLAELEHAARVAREAL